MHLIVIDEGIGNLRYRKGYKISGKLKKELEKIYFIDLISTKIRVISKEEGENIREFYSKLLNLEKPFVAIGGDHSVSFFLYQNFKGKPLVIFDAHPDLEFSTKFPTNEDWLRLLIEERLVNPEKVYLVGIRNFAPHEMNFIKEKGINFLLCNEIESSDDISSFIPRKDFYLSIDIDVLDPAFAPGTYFREPFGLNPKLLIDALSRTKPLSMDITEINLDFDVNFITLRLALYISAIGWRWIVEKE